MLAFSTASSEAAYPKTLEELERFGCQQSHRELRAAGRLLVQSRRLDDVLHVRGDVHRAGVRHRALDRSADRDGRDPDAHVEGHGRRAARVAGRHRRDARAVQHPGGRARCCCSASITSSTWAARPPTSSATASRRPWSSKWEGELRRDDKSAPAPMGAPGRAESLALGEAGRSSRPRCAGTCGRGRAPSMGSSADRGCSSA